MCFKNSLPSTFHEAFFFPGRSIIQFPTISRTIHDICKIFHDLQFTCFIINIANGDVPTGTNKIAHSHFYRRRQIVKPG